MTDAAKSIRRLQRIADETSTVLKEVARLQAERRKFLSLSAKLLLILDMPSFEVGEKYGFNIPCVINLDHNDRRVQLALASTLSYTEPKFYDEVLRRMDELRGKK